MCVCYVMSCLYLICQAIQSILIISFIPGHAFATSLFGPIWPRPNWVHWSRANLAWIHLESFGADGLFRLWVQLSGPLGSIVCMIYFQIVDQGYSQFHHVRKTPIYSLIIRALHDCPRQLSSPGTEVRSRISGMIGI